MYWLPVYSMASASSFQPLRSWSLSASHLTMTTKMGGADAKPRPKRPRTFQALRTLCGSRLGRAVRLRGPLRRRRREVALGGRKGNSRRRGRRVCGSLLGFGATAIMPGIVELPTLEDLKVQEVRLVRKPGKRGIGLQLFGPGPSPAASPWTVGPGSPHAVPPPTPQHRHRSLPDASSSPPGIASPPPHHAVAL